MVFSQLFWQRKYASLFAFQKWINTSAALSTDKERKDCALWVFPFYLTDMFPLLQCFPTEFLLICLNVIRSIIMLLYRQGENGTLRISNNETLGGHSICIPCALRWSPSRHLLNVYTSSLQNHWQFSKLGLQKKDRHFLIKIEGIHHPSILLICIIYFPYS